MDEGRAPGWYPDPRGTGRRRHWDGERWNELSASPDLDTEGPSALPRGPVRPGDPFARRRVVLAGVGVLVLLVVLGGAFLALGDRDDPETAGVTTTERIPGTTAGGTVAPTSPVDPDGERAPAGSTAEPTPTVASTTAPPSPASAPDTSCIVPVDELLAALRAYEPLAGFTDTLTVADPRCTGEWATAVVSAPQTDSALAVLRRSGTAWGVLLVGSAEPCSGLDIPPDHQTLLGCDFR